MERTYCTHCRDSGLYVIEAGTVICACTTGKRLAGILSDIARGLSVQITHRCLMDGPQVGLETHFHIKQVRG